MAPPDRPDATDPAARNAQLEEERIRQQKDGGDVLKPQDKANPSKLREVVPKASGNSGQDHSVAAQWGRETYGNTPRDITFGTDSGSAIFGKEYSDNGKPMLLSPDGTRYEGTMNADGNGIASWQKVQADGKLGPAMNVTAERSGLPSNPAKPESYVANNQARVRDTQNEGGAPARPTLASATETAALRSRSVNQPAEAPNQSLNFAPLHKGDVVQPAKPAPADAGTRSDTGVARNFGDMTRAERREAQAQMRADGGGGNNWNQYLDKGIARTPGGEKVVGRAQDAPDKSAPAGKPDKVDAKAENRPENVKPDTKSDRIDKATTSGAGSQPFDAAPRQNRPDAPTGKADVDNRSADSSRGRNAGDIFPATPNREISPSLLKQLGPEGAKRLADLIADMQAGKGGLGRDNVDILKALQGLKPEQLTNLRGALGDGKFNLDPKLFDGKSQESIAKIIEQLSKGTSDGGGRPGSAADLGASGRILDLLQGKQFDKIPSGDQSRQILAELFKGFKDGGSLAGGTDLSALLGRSLMKPGEVSTDGRSLGQIPGMKFDLKDSGPLMQALMARLELGKVSEGSISQIGKLADALAQKLDTKDGAALEVKAELKTQNTLDIGKLGDAVRSAILSGELSRSIGKEQVKDAQSTQKDATNQAIVQDDGAPLSKTEMLAAAAKTEAELTQKRVEEEAAKQKKLQTEESGETIKQKGPTPEQLAQELAERQKLEDQRKAQEKEERERKEKKRKEDAERVHVVKKGETVSEISRKYFSNEKNSQIVFARNKSTIKVVNYKGQPYCSLKEGQKLYVPSPKFVDNFMKGTTSFNHINFGKIPFSSPEEELAFLFGGADLGAAAGLLGLNKKRPSLFNHEDSEPPTRRSFSGKESVDDDERRANVEQILNPTSAKKPLEMEGIKHTVRLGETLSSIALRRYGQAAYWRLIAWKNKLQMEDSTAHSKMTRGLILYMPTNDEMSAYDSDPERMLHLAPSKTGLFIQSESRISMPALKICPDCGRTTFYTAVVCMRCDTDLSDIPLIIDALGLGVEIDLVDLDGHLPGESPDLMDDQAAVESFSDHEDAESNGHGGSSEHTSTSESAHHEQYHENAQFDEPEPVLPQKEPATAEAAIELTDSIVPHQEVEPVDPSIVEEMSQAEPAEAVDHVGDIPLPDVEFARRNSQSAAFMHAPVSSAESAVPDILPSELSPEDLSAQHDDTTSMEFEEHQAPSQEFDFAQEQSVDNSTQSSFAPAGEPDAQPDPSHAAQASSEDSPLEPADLMQHTEEDEAAMMELFPDVDSVIEEPITRCEFVDDMVRIAERGVLSEKDGLRITLEMVSDGEWSKVCQYRIYDFNCFIEFYCRANGSRRPDRVQEKSLQAKIATEMARNHLKRSWQDLCTEFWHS